MRGACCAAAHGWGSWLAQSEQRDQARHAEQASPLHRQAQAVPLPRFAGADMRSAVRSSGEYRDDPVPHHARDQREARDRLGGTRRRRLFRPERRLDRDRGAAGNERRGRGALRCLAASARKARAAAPSARRRLRVFQLRSQGSWRTGPMICAAVAWIMPTPRPYCATAPDSVRSVCTSTLEPAPGLEPERGGGLGAAAALGVAALRLHARGVVDVVDLLELHEAREGQRHRPKPHGKSCPCRFAHRPRRSAPPGMHGAMRRMSISTAHACAGGSGTSNELSNSIPPSILSIVSKRLVPAFTSFACAGVKTWMPGTRPGMTDRTLLSAAPDHLRPADLVPYPSRARQQTLVVVRCATSWMPTGRLFGPRCVGSVMLGVCSRGPDRLHGAVAGRGKALRRLALHAWHQHYVVSLQTPPPAARGIARCAASRRRNPAATSSGRSRYASHHLRRAGLTVMVPFVGHAGGALVEIDGLARDHAQSGERPPAD